MVIVKLARFGKKKSPFYKIVVTDRKYVRNGCFIEKIGFFDPIFSPKKKNFLQIKMDRLQYWKDQGAIFSEKVKWIVKTMRKSDFSKT
ncbi:30S ribosomal protein S16 [Candidatus Riesia pediculicola]|uniref:30S ribosomal protein S16 n=1 Tax=Candidatus Riesia pediculicola TaxID=401619 RepID=UPI0009C272DE|nr:30S ribosomal protein S16 [Candidatus Riesia pediculicola]ARC54458.1 30S ribosomal protein S16 [Candidatus Riesia pediculicola]